MTAVEEALDKGIMTGIEADVLLLDPNKEDITLYGVPIASSTITTIEMTAGIQDFEVPPDCLPGDPELHQEHPVEIETDVLTADNLVILPENVWRRMLQ